MSNASLFFLLTYIGESFNALFNSTWPGIIFLVPPVANRAIEELPRIYAPLGQHELKVHTHALPFMHVIRRLIAENCFWWLNWGVIEITFFDARYSKRFGKQQWTEETTTCRIPNLLWISTSYKIKHWFSECMKCAKHTFNFDSQ